LQSFDPRRINLTGAMAKANAPKTLPRARSAQGDLVAIN
jgi:hypothetical protein